MTLRGPLKDRGNRNEKKKIAEFGCHVNNYRVYNYASDNSSPIKLLPFSGIM